MNPIAACRACGSKKLTLVLSLGTLYISHFVSSRRKNLPKAPLALIFCNTRLGGCGLVQLRHSIPPAMLYQNQYWYVSGTNQSMREALADITRRAELLIPLSQGDVVLDIGCNDGTLLRSYTTPGIVRVGFEPAKNLLARARRGTSKIINDFFNAEAFIAHFGSKKAKTITSIAMFYDLEDPNRFVADIAKVLAGDGTWIIQMSYLPAMLAQNAFDNICHEHLEYYAMAPLRKLLRGHGLEAFDVERNDVNGGSFRIFIRHANSRLPRPLPGATKRLRALDAYERGFSLEKAATYRAFAKRIESLKTQLRRFLEKETRRGKKIFVYGASTKGNTLLQYFELRYPLIRAAAERNPEKFGKKTVGTWIPIVSEAQARREKPDYFLVLPWHFKKEFLRREKDFMHKGGMFIFPLPRMELYGYKQ